MNSKQLPPKGKTICSPKCVLSNTKYTVYKTVLKINYRLYCYNIYYCLGRGYLYN